VTYSSDPELHLDRIEALAAAAGLAVDEYLQAAVAAQARRNHRRPSESSLYARIQYAGGLRRLVDKLYPRVLADPSLTGYFKHLNDEHLKGLRWHMLTLLAVVTGGPTNTRAETSTRLTPTSRSPAWRSNGWPGTCSERFRTLRSKSKTSRRSLPRCKHGDRRS
jgi:hypothetical protein